MKKVDKLGSAKRFGSRYGSKPKHKFAKIEKEQRRKHKCPYCSYTAVKRVAVGIWKCNKCDAKFTGKAYTVGKPLSIATVSMKEEEPVIEQEEAAEQEEAGAEEAKEDA